MDWKDGSKPVAGGSQQPTTIALNLLGQAHSIPRRELQRRLKDSGGHRIEFIRNNSVTGTQRLEWN